jgi:GT2 family glycosyltransferase
MSQTQDSIKVAIIVLNYRTPDLVVDCLRSLEGQVDSNTTEVVIVDNCSGDESVGRIEASLVDNGWSSWARVVRSPVNGGFAAGNNVGIKSCNADMYMLLNSDTIVRLGALEALISVLDQNSDVDIIAPQLEWPDGTSQISTFRYRTPVTELLYASKVGFFGRVLSKHVVARELHGFTTGLDWASFACIVIRKEVFDHLGLLDERYFMYFEDMAFCRKATRAGFNIAYQPEARVVHLRGGTSSVKEKTEQRERRPGYYYAARSHYLQTFYGVSGRFFANILWTLGWMLGSVRGRSGAVAKEFIDIWKSPRSQVHRGAIDE